MLVTAVLRLHRETCGVNPNRNGLRWRTATMQGQPVVGAIPTSSAIFRAALIRYVCSERFMAQSCVFCKRQVQRVDIIWFRAAKAEPRSCLRATLARISFTRPGVTTNFAARSTRWKPFWPTPVSKDFSSGCINSKKPQFSEVNEEGRGGLGNTARLDCETTVCQGFQNSFGVP